MFKPENELGVIIVFAQSAQEAGFEILRISIEFPDATIKRGDMVYQVEFEYQSASFRKHGHDPRECDLVICWEHDGDCGGLPVLALSDQNWASQPIILASQEAKEIAYWRWRAELAEQRLDIANCKLMTTTTNRKGSKATLRDWRFILDSIDGDERARHHTGVQELLAEFQFAPAAITTARRWAEIANSAT